jgi:periplasmic copper chaperone A
MRARQWEPHHSLVQVIVDGTGVVAVVPIAQHVEMHSMTSIGGLMQMRQVLSVDVPAKGGVRFERGGLHVMLIDLTQPLKEGQRLPLTLVFQHAGSMRVEAIVQGLGATAAPSQGEAAHEHHQ